MTKLSIPLVGMHFRPPAAQVLAALPLGFVVYLRKDPSNEYDPNAVRVVADLDECDSSTILRLDAMLGSSRPTGAFELGYLAKTGGKPAAGGPGNVEALLLMASLEAKLNMEVEVPEWKRYKGKISALPTGTPSIDMEY